MKMEKMNVEFVEFDAKDVITTSTPGGGPLIPTTIQAIWLSTDSITNFNNYSTKYGETYPTLNSSTSPSSGDYYSFTGSYLATPYSFLASTGTYDTPTEGLYVVSAKDDTNYWEVLAWLQAKVKVK